MTYIKIKFWKKCYYFICCIILKIFIVITYGYFSQRCTYLPLLRNCISVCSTLAAIPQFEYLTALLSSKVPRLLQNSAITSPPLMFYDKQLFIPSLLALSDKNASREVCYGSNFKLPQPFQYSHLRCPELSFSVDSYRIMNFNQFLFKNLNQCLQILRHQTIFLPKHCSMYHWLYYI